MMLAYIYDFLSLLFEKGVQGEVKRVILYGTAAEGKAGNGEELKLFIEVWNPHKAAAVEKTVQERLKSFEERALRLWGPKGIKNRISISVGNLDSSKWISVKEDVLSTGLVLYGSSAAKEGGEHRTLITFSLAKLRQKDKMKLIRRLYGYELKKGAKKYRMQGLVEECGGAKISSNSVLVPMEKKAELENLLSRFKVAPELKEVWTP